MSTFEYPNENMDEIQLNLSGSNSNNNNNGNEFLNQMEQVFKAIDRDNQGIITLLQFRQEIESLSGDIDDNPLLSKLYNYIKVVHTAQRRGLPLSMSTDNDSLALEEDQSESDIQVDFYSFMQTMQCFGEDVDPKEARKQRLERLKLPKFKIPLDLLKKYNITPRLTSQNNSNNSTPNSNLSTPNSGTSTPSRSPSKNKFGRLFSVKPVIEFDQFNDLLTRLNYGKEIPKSKLLLFLQDLPKDQDECIDGTQFLSRYAGLNHPMSPKLTFDSSNLSNSGGHILSSDDQLEISSPGSSSHLYGSKTSQLLEQMADLESENQSYMSEIQNLEKYKHTMDQILKKKEMEIEKLKRESRFVDGMRDSNKDLTVQNNNLKTHISKLSNTEENLKVSIQEERERARSLNESNILKELEIKKLQLLLKTQQNINNKLSMMVTFSNEVDNGVDPSKATGNEFKDKTFTFRRIKPAVDKAKQILTKQKSDFFTDTLKNYQSPLSSSGTQSPLSQSSNNDSSNAQSLESEFQELVKQEQQQQQSEEQQQQQSEQNIENQENDEEFNQLKDQLNVSDISLPIESNLDDLPSSTSINNLSSILNNSNSNTPNVKSPYNSLPSRSLTSPIYNKNTSSPSLKVSIQPPQPITTNLSPTSNNVPNSSISVTSSASLVSSPLATSNNLNLNLSSPIAANSNTPNNQSSLSPLSLSSSNQYGSIKLKKIDLVLLHTNELKEHNETTENIINQMKDHLDNNNQQIEKLSQQLLFEKYNNKLLEDQIRYERDLAMTTNTKQNSTANSAIWGFFSLFYNILPTSLLCNASSTP